MPDPVTVVAPKFPCRNQRRCRPFSLGDGLILVAALTLAMGLFRSYLTSCAQAFVIPFDPGQVVWTRFHCAMLVLLSATFTSLAFRLRSPRPRRRVLVRQPGLIACGTAIVATLLSCSFDIGQAVLHGTAPSIWFLFVRAEVPAAGSAVFVAWLVLAVSGRWRREPSWIDRFGQTVGGSWIALSFVFEGWQIYAFE